MGSLGRRLPQFSYQDMADVTEIDWEGNVVWSFNRKEFCEDGEDKHWLARMHHDFQRMGSAVYYTPGEEKQCFDQRGTLILSHENLYNHEISDKRLLDDCIIETDWEGNITWKWNVNEHFHEIELSEQAKTVLFRNPNYHDNGGGESDWMHINSASYIGPNQWYDAGDERFHPDNIIWSSREANLLAIVSHETGKIVWQLGADFTRTPELRAIGQIIGMHHAHIIPRGLPGEGNLMIFDNGGFAGYGYPSGTSVDGTKCDIRDHSRVLEINPVTLEVVWSFTGDVWGGMNPMVAKSKFYSPLLSCAQRLPNGNTMITEGAFHRIFEVTAEKELVWEFVAPFEFDFSPRIYRAYRVPYSYIPQAAVPEEVAIEQINIKKFRMPGAASCEIQNVVTVEGTWGFRKTTIVPKAGSAQF